MENKQDGRLKQDNLNKSSDIILPIATAMKTTS